MKTRHTLWGLGLAAALLIAPAQAQPSLEYAVKAAYLIKFLPFIDWPPGLFSSPTTPVTICLWGSDPFGAALDKAAAAGAGGRPVIIKRLAASDPVDGCQVVFTADPTAVIAPLRDKPLITVTDSTIQTRGTISLLMMDNHVRFDIDETDAQASNIRISSKLLELAHKVTRRTAP